MLIEGDTKLLPISRTSYQGCIREKNQAKRTIPDHIQDVALRLGRKWRPRRVQVNEAERVFGASAAVESSGAELQPVNISKVIAIQRRDDSDFMVLPLFQYFCCRSPVLIPFIFAHLPPVPRCNRLVTAGPETAGFGSCFLFSFRQVCSIRCILDVPPG